MWVPCKQESSRFRRGGVLVFLSTTLLTKVQLSVRNTFARESNSSEISRESFKTDTAVKVLIACRP